MLVDPDERAVDEDVFEIRIVAEGLENALPDTLLRPAPEARRYGLREYVDAGGLIACGVNLAGLFRPRRSAPIFRRRLLLGPTMSSNSGAFFGAA